MQTWPPIGPQTPPPGRPAAAQPGREGPAEPPPARGPARRLLHSDPHPPRLRPVGGTRAPERVRPGAERPRPGECWVRGAGARGSRAGVGTQRALGGQGAARIGARTGRRAGGVARGRVETRPGCGCGARRRGVRTQAAALAGGVPEPGGGGRGERARLGFPGKRGCLSLVEIQHFLSKQAHFI